MKLKDLPLGSKVHHLHPDNKGNIDSHYILMTEWTPQIHTVKTYGGITEKGKEVWKGDGSQDMEQEGDMWFDVSSGKCCRNNFT